MTPPMMLLRRTNYAKVKATSTETYIANRKRIIGMQDAHRSKAYWYSTGYIGSVVAANLTLQYFITLPILGVFTFGTLFFAFTFTFRDRVHRLTGSRPFVYRMIAATAIANIIAAWATNTPARFIVASFVAILIAESADTEVFQALRSRSWITRVLSSNAVSVPLDTAVFVAIAFIGSLPTKILWQIFQNDVIWKYAIATIVAMNLTSRARKQYATS
jgi:uncharacterized PurR-regulated membrane protein YhhQ (DUF165 family)